MSANYWTSTQCNHWLLDRPQLALARREDLKYASHLETGAIGIFFSNLISLLCKRQNMRQRVVATSCVFFRRFFAKNSYAAMDPFLVAVACVYVAAKVEESPVHIKSMVQEGVRTCYELGHSSFPPDNSSLAEMEFYLLEEMEFDLVIHHPYRALVALYETVGTKTQGETGLAQDQLDQFGVQKGLTSAEQLDSGIESTSDTVTPIAEFDGQVLQMAWFVLNDACKTDIPLMHPPYMVALAALWLGLVLHLSSRDRIEASVKQMKDQRAQYQTLIADMLNSGTPTLSPPPDPPSQDTLTFFASLNISLPLLAEIVQDLMSHYHLRSAATTLVNDGPKMVQLLFDMRDKRRQDLAAARAIA